MHHEQDDPALARLRAADPAASAHLDLDRLRAVARERAGLGTAGPASATPEPLNPEPLNPEPLNLEATMTTDDDVPVLVPRSASTPRRWLPAVAAAVALVVGAGGGWALAHRGGSTSGAAETIGQVSSKAEVRRGSDGTSAAMAVGKVEFAGEGRARYVGSGLSEQAGTAHAWGFTAAAATSTQVAKAAAALQVSGTPTRSAGQWVVGTSDDSSRTLSVSTSAAATLSFTDFSLCRSIEPQLAVRPAPAVNTPMDYDGSTPLPTPMPSSSAGASSCDGDAPSSASAVATVRAALTALGVDLTGSTFTAEQQGSSTTVNVSRDLGGGQAPAVWNGTVVVGGLENLQGPLSPLVDLGSYPVVSAAAAVARVGDSRYGLSPQVIALGSAAASSASSAGGGTVAAEGSVAGGGTVRVAPGAALPWAVTTVTLTGASLTLASTALAGDAVAYVPTWQLTTADGGTYAVVALADSALDVVAG